MTNPAGLAICFGRKYALYVVPFQHIRAGGDAVGILSYNRIGIFLGKVIFSLFRADNDIIVLSRSI